MKVAISSVVLERVYGKVKIKAEEMCREAILRKYPMAVLEAVEWGNICHAVHNEEGGDGIPSPHYHLWVEAETSA